jgi:thymidylate synthase (FAD)
MIDLLQNNDDVISVDNKCGFVKLIDCMPRLVEDDCTADNCIAEAARVSYNKKVVHNNKRDRNLIRYLMRNDHTSPFEMVEMKWYIKLPIFVARQWVRHRTASINEISGRYSMLKNDFFEYGEDDIRNQSDLNKQATFGNFRDLSTDEFVDEQRKLIDISSKCYKNAVQNKVPKEQARIILPLSLYTEWIWKCDLHNTLRFLKLRLHKSAQYEIRVYAEAMLKIIKNIAPYTIEAFEDYILNKTVFTSVELKAIDILKKSGRFITIDNLKTTKLLDEIECEELLSKYIKTSL